MGHEFVSWELAECFFVHKAPFQNIAPSYLRKEKAAGKDSGESFLPELQKFVVNLPTPHFPCLLRFLNRDQKNIFNSSKEF